MSAPDLVATAGSATANSFVGEDAADSYMEGRLNASAFTGASVTADTRVIALIEATREITRLTYVGTRTDAVQALAWPRSYALNPDAPSAAYIEDSSDLYFATTEIPQRIKDATCELALEFLKSGTTDLVALDRTAGVIRTKVDVLEKEYAKPHERPTGLARFPRVAQLLAPLLEPSGMGLTLVRC